MTTIFNDETTLRYCGFRGLAAFRIPATKTGCVVMWKPTFLALGVEIWERGGGVYLGPVAFGFGPVDAGEGQSNV